MRTWRLHPWRLCLLVAPTLGAQQVCDKPGAAFGITSYHCDSCTVERKGGRRPTWVFHADPSILEATAASGLHPGDIVQAVNGNRLSTARGAESFVYPAAGVARVTVLRGGVKREISVDVRTACDSSSLAPE